VVVLQLWTRRATAIRWLNYASTETTTSVTSGPLFASYRFNPTVYLSGKFNYESNFPVVGFFQGNPAASDQTANFTLSDQRNQLRVPTYTRMDTRLNKAYYYKRFKVTLDVEIDNMMNHKNWRYFGLQQYDFSTGKATMRAR